MKNGLSRKTSLLRNPRFRLLLFLAVLFALFTSLNLLAKYNGYADLPDLLVFETALYNTLRGDFLYNFRGGDVCHLGIHFSPMLLVYLPFYALFQHVFTLFLFQGLWVGSGALGIYFLAKRLLKNEGAAFLLGAAFLVNPITLGGVMWSIHEEPLAVPLFIFAIYSWRTGRTALFWILMIGAMLCKETMALVAAFFGLALLIRTWKTGRGRGAGIVLFLGSVLWFFFATRVLMPLFSPLSLGDLQLTARYDSRIGHSLPEMIVNFFRRPGFFFQTALETKKIAYLVKLMLPVGFFGLLAPVFLLPVLPVVAMNVLSHKLLWHATLLHQYSIVAGPFLFLAAMEGIRRLRISVYRRGKTVSARRLSLFCSGAILACSLAAFFVSDVYPWTFFTRDARKSHLPLFSRESREAAREALSLIPPDAPVSASHLVANHLAKRKVIYYNSEPQIRLLPFEYFVIVKSGPMGDDPEEFSEKTVRFFQEECNILYSRDRFLVLKRKKRPIPLEEFRRRRRGKDR